MDETIYTFILTKTDGTYLGWSKAKEEKEAGEGMKWIKWGKTLPLDIDTAGYIYKDGRLINE
jgi:hypothetical protein